MKYNSINAQIIANTATVATKLNPVEVVKGSITNLAEERDKWLKAFQNRFYCDPQFHYDRSMLRAIAGLQGELAMGRNHLATRIEPETPAEYIMKDILLHRIEGAIQTTELAASILLCDDKSTHEIVQSIYGHPTNTQVVRAYQIVDHEFVRPHIRARWTKKDRKALEKMTFDATQIKYWFDEVINLYGVEGWTVEIGDRFPCIDVRNKDSSGKQVVGIPTSRKVTGLKLLELIGHELECHLLGSENCRAVVEEILGADSPLAPLFPLIAKSDNELLYEGVAKISDVRTNGNDGLPQAYATIACDQARRGASFREIAQMIYGQRREMGQKEDAAIKGAWTTAFRTICGSTNPSKGGYAFTKDYIYMGGFDLAQTVDPSWLDFSSFTVEEIEAITKVHKLSPRHPNLDATDWVKIQLLP